MQWRGRRQSGNVIDRRGTARSGGTPRSPIGGMLGGGGGGMFGGRGGGMGGAVGLLVILIVGALLLGVNPMDLLTGQTDSAAEDTAPAGALQDEGGQFVATVLADTEDIWTAIFRENGSTYVLPTLVLFSGSTNSACGFASAATGPFYCPADQRVYIDLAFYDELRSRFEAPGDFAQAYVIAHEVGHHVQQLMGNLARQNAARSEAEANRLSIQVELQADCFAGIWANRTAEFGYIEPGDLDEALNAAAQIGDDAIQRREQGYVVPETFNHGTSVQRATWFGRGFDAGNVAACDTFNAPGL